MKLQKVLNQKGFSLLEAMVTGAFVALAATVAIKTSGDFNEGANSVKRDSRANEIVSNVVENIFSRASEYQINYQAASSAVERLPYYWDRNGEISNLEEGCPACRGRFGVQVRPVPEHPGLVYVDVQLAHPEFKQQVQSYTRVISL